MGPPRHARRRRPRPRVRDQARAPQPAARPRRRRRRPRPPGGSACSTPPSRSRAGRTHDDVVITQDEIAASGLDYLALGHWHGAQVAKARGVTYAYSGAPEPVALDQDKAGKVLLVTLDAKGEDEARSRSRSASSARRRSSTGRSTRRRSSRSRRSSPSSAPARARTRVLDVRLIGVRPDELDLAHRRGRGGPPRRLPPRPGPGPEPPAADRGRDPPGRDRRRRVHPRGRGADRRPPGLARHGGPARGGRAARRAPARPAAARRPRGDAVRITSLAHQGPPPPPRHDRRARPRA